MFSMSRSVNGTRVAHDMISLMTLEEIKVGLRAELLSGVWTKVEFSATIGGEAES